MLISFYGIILIVIFSFPKQYKQCSEISIPSICLSVPLIASWCVICLRRYFYYHLDFWWCILKIGHNASTFLLPSCSSVSASLANHFIFGQSNLLWPKKHDWSSWPLLTLIPPHLALELLKRWLNQLPPLWWGFLVLTSHLGQKILHLMFDKGWNAFNHFNSAQSICVQFIVSFHV